MISRLEQVPMIRMNPEHLPTGTMSQYAGVFCISKINESSKSSHFESGRVFRLREYIVIDDGVIISTLHQQWG